jgi:hypothetical protein
MILRVIGGILLILAGLPFVLKTQWFLQNFGSVAWAEAKLGSGGTWLFYKLIGIGISLIGILMATGLLGGLLIGTVGRLFVPQTP